MAGQPYSPADDATICRIHEEWGGKNGWLQAASRALGRNQNGVSDRFRVIRGRSVPLVATLTRDVRNEGGVRVLAPLETDLEPEDAFLRRVIQATRDSVNAHKAERYVRVRIESDLPVAINISSDWHLSSTSATDVEGLLGMADLVGKTPRMYAVAVGDQTDNPIKHQPVRTGDIPDDLRLLDIMLGRFNTKLLGMTSGNHDDWTKTMVGVDNLATMAERHAIHYAPDELVWLVEIVKPGTDEVTARWVIATRHQYRRHSNLNHCHACWRWLEEDMHNWPSDPTGSVLLPDVVAIGHNHVAAVEHRTYQRGTVIACRMGSWQYTSRFTRAKGFTLMPPTAPTVILPNIRDGIMQPHAYEDYAEAIRVLRTYDPPQKALPKAQREKQSRRPSRRRAS